MGVDNSEINSLISEYNLNILDRKKLVLSAGSNNPSIKQMDNLISDTRSNIIFSLKNHLVQLNNLKEKLSKQFYKFDSQVSNLPEKEKSLDRSKEISRLRNHLSFPTSKKRRSRGKLCSYRAKHQSSRICNTK